jgi:hypothetical protein
MAKGVDRCVAKRVLSYSLEDNVDSFIADSPFGQIRVYANNGSVAFDSWNYQLPALTLTIDGVEYAAEALFVSLDASRWIRKEFKFSLVKQESSLRIHSASQKFEAWCLEYIKAISESQWSKIERASINSQIDSARSQIADKQRDISRLEEEIQEHEERLEELAGEEPATV